MLWHLFHLSVVSSDIYSKFPKTMAAVTLIFPTRAFQIIPNQQHIVGIHVIKKLIGPELDRFIKDA